MDKEADVVGHLIEGADVIVTPEEMLLLGQQSGFPINLCREGLIEFGTYITELVVRRMILNARVTFLASCGYNTYSAGEGFTITNPADKDGFYVHGNMLERVVDTAYEWVTENLT